LPFECLTSPRRQPARRIMAKSGAVDRRPGHTEWTWGVDTVVPGWRGVIAQFNFADGEPAQSVQVLVAGAKKTATAALPHGSAAVLLVAGRAGGRYDRSNEAVLRDTDRF